MIAGNGCYADNAEQAKTFHRKSGQNSKKQQSLIN
jgi:hypothetical protein